MSKVCQIKEKDRKINTDKETLAQNQREPPPHIFCVIYIYIYIYIYILERRGHQITYIKHRNT